MFSPNKYSSAPLFGAPTRERTTLAYFKGRLLMHNPPYSRGIRQNLTVYAREWRAVCSTSCCLSRASKATPFHASWRLFILLLLLRRCLDWSYPAGTYLVDRACQ